MRWRLSPIVALLLMIAPLGAADEIKVIENGALHCSIVVPADAPDVMKFAGEEMAHYLKALSGADVPIVAAKQANTLAIELQPRPWRDEAFDIARDSTGITIKAGERAILPAVYHVLEGLGCRFLSPQFDFYEGH